MISLFSGYKTAHLTLRNRVVMAPMTRARAGNKGVPTDLAVEYYRQRASAGLIISEGIAVSPNAVGGLNIPGIFHSDQIEGWKKVTAAVHERGAVMFAQLWHVGRMSHPDLLGNNLPLAPSAINPNDHVYTASGYAQTVTPKEMSLEDIERTIQEFCDAAQNASYAGFDGIELHAANGYLFHQFFAKCANQRTDKYGGSIDNRSRFLFDVLDRIRKIATSIKIAVRLSPDWNNLFGITTDDETQELFTYLCTLLNDYDLAYLHIAGFPLNSTDDPMKQMLASATYYRKFYSGTYMVNRDFDKETANQAIDKNIADLVSFGKLYIANPDLVERFKANAPLNPVNQNSYYTGAAGYTDYPTMESF
ncbi:alkene reductase [Chitinophaga sp. G-6-1-13]|uniref:Alkene reductase n=1 Tax=Chitinophaga fulva TaxID=2728842 RepID=A0A848GRE2_9BACT|nr:alkene reductase [Chitinophaga fulva]NML40091.1 alkene reductase [Chitinophaga fulva]